jgi:hypothetical protein
MASTKRDKENLPENDESLPPDLREHHRRVRLQAEGFDQGLVEETPKKGSHE